jgi:hypothetical protein
MQDTITLTNGSEVGTGTWLDGCHGWTNTYRIIEIAESHGFTMDADERAALEWYKGTSGGCGDGTDAEENMAEVIVGQGGLSDRASDHMEELLPAGWTLLWDAGELSLVRDYVACAEGVGGCKVDYDHREHREVVIPCHDHRHYEIRVELLRTDDVTFSYGVGLHDIVDPDAVRHGWRSITFEAPGLDNLRVEGAHPHPSAVDSKDVREAAEGLVEEYENSRG